MSVVASQDIDIQKPREPFKNFLKLVASGDIIEIFKILKRRLLNSLKFIRRIFRALLSPILDQPAIKRGRDNRRIQKILHKYYGKPSNTAESVKVCIIARDGATHPKSSAFIRLVAPLSSGRLAGKVDINLLAENTIDISQDASVCIVQRTAFDSIDFARNLVDNLRSHNTTLIVDVDDAFHVIDPTHPEYTEHKERIEAMDYLINNASQIWLSVPRLKKHISHNQATTLIMQNSLDKRIWMVNSSKTQIDYRSNKPLQLLYMGTVTHDADLDIILPALKRVNDKYPGSFVLTVVGVSKDLAEEPWIRRLHQKRGFSIYPKFVRWFLQQGPYDLGLSPLVDNEFNRCKSDIKCLDYLAAGIIPMVSDIEPYKLPELSSHITKIKNTSDSWEQALEAIVKNISDFRKSKPARILQAQAYLWNHRSSEDAADLIARQFESLKILN